MGALVGAEWDGELAGAEVGELVGIGVGELVAAGVDVLLGVEAGGLVAAGGGEPARWSVQESVT